MSIKRPPTEKVLVTIPEEQVRVLDGLVAQGIAPTRSSLVQQIIGAFVAEASRRSRQGTMADDAPKTIDNAVEALIAYFLYSLGRTAIDELFGGNK
jgi:Arc/MetJ-type ribon-helix-helix transcriptional regulator